MRPQRPGKPLPGRRWARAFAEGIMRKALRTTFRRVVWVGERPALPPGVPVALYANHHGFYDGYLLWYLCQEVLHRPILLWMEEWDRFPLFGPAGALPFPVGDARRRAATVRDTAQRLAADPSHVFIVFPEAVMRPPDAGLGDFSPDNLPRLARLLPPATVWWPVAMHLTWWGEAQPTALLTADAPAARPDGHERARLLALLDRLRQTFPDPRYPGTLPDGCQVLLEGPRSPQEQWDFARLAPLFARWT